LAGALGETVHHAFLQSLTLGFTDGLVGSLVEAQEQLNEVKIIPRAEDRP
jgi:hypothetical protein